MEQETIDFDHPPTTTDPDALYEILTGQARTYMQETQDLDLLHHAYEYAAQAHAGVIRDSGEAYITHPLHVALILAYLKIDSETLAAALLHDVIEDTPATREDLTELFGDSVGRLVDGVTKLNLLSKWSKREQDAANILKVIMSMSDDVRVIFVKLADRLHNLRTLHFKRRQASRERTAREALEVYARIADRLGIAIMRKEMEDIAFYHLDRKNYQRIKAITQARYKENCGRIERIQKEVLALLRGRGIETIDHGIQPNPRRIYDTFHRKQQTSNPRLDTLRRVPPQLRFHVFVADEPSCYLTMGEIHARWPPITSETRDYISSPLPNGYQSLHTTVFIDRQPVKFQIRTMAMNETSQLGIIAQLHSKDWSYTPASLKDSIASLSAFSDQGLDGVEDPLGMLDTLKAEQLETEIYVYSPQNDMFKLPVGSTAIDFAYKVHTEVGHQCRGAIVDGHWTPLNRPLRTGEHIVILTGKTLEPNFNWLNPDLDYTKSPTAREKIRRWFRQHAQGDQIALGRQQLRRISNRLSIKVKDWSALAKRWGCKDERELFLLIGGCQVALESLMPELIDIYGKDHLPAIEDAKKEEAIIGIGSLDNTLSNCCQPKPGEDIVGYIDGLDHIVHIHRSDCPEFIRQLEADSTRYLNLRWGYIYQTLQTCMEIQAYDRPFFLRDALDILYDEEINIAQVEVKVHRSKDALITIGIDIQTWVQFNRVLTRIEDLPGAIQVRRIPQDQVKARRNTPVSKRLSLSDALTAPFNKLLYAVRTQTQDGLINARVGK